MGRVVSQSPMSPLVRCLCVPILLLFATFAARVQAGEIVTLTVQPSKSGSGIGAELLARNYHYVAQPRLATQRKNVLVVFPGGSNSSPGAYTEVSHRQGAGHSAFLA
jgi:hypothetical protein